MEGSMPKQSFLRSYSCPHLKYAVCPLDVYKITLKNFRLKNGDRSCIHWSENEYLKFF